MCISILETAHKEPPQSCILVLRCEGSIPVQHDASAAHATKIESQLLWWLLRSTTGTQTLKDTDSVMFVSSPSTHGLCSCRPNRLNYFETAFCVPVHCYVIRLYLERNHVIIWASPF
ncbi:unnamed protein product, partial [Ectocarpus sp. 4 AP-2014]